MSAERFTLDANILFYSLDREAGSRHLLAKVILADAPQTECILVLQAISECYAAVTRKRKAHSAFAAAQALDWMTVFPLAAVSPNAIRAALAVTLEQKAAYWDALLLATAAEAGCSAILSEDMADGTTLLGVRIVNPFDGERLAARAASLLDAVGD